MSTNPLAPRWLNGAIVTIDMANPGAPPATIAFQYNLEKRSRTLRPQMAGGEQGQRSEVVGVTGAPEETFDLTVTVEAIDQLTAGDALLDQGQIEIGGGFYDAQLTLFVWGPKRVLPVMITRCSISEEESDANLNLLRADVTPAMPGNRPKLTIGNTDNDQVAIDNRISGCAMGTL